jgi:hypothetical protein
MHHRPAGREAAARPTRVELAARVTCVTDPPATNPRPAPQTGTAPIPGEASRPATLARPPGERYRARSADAVLESPRVGRAIALGLAGVVITAAAMALLYGVLSITAGLLAVAALGGWMIGAGVRKGAWDGLPHRPSGAPTALAILLAAVAWLAGLVAAWLVSLATIQASSRSFLERVAATPFLDWLAPQLGALEIVDLLLLVGVAAYASRSPGLERRDTTSGVA